MEWPLFVAKSIIGGALNPICISLLLCLTGATLWILRPRRRVGFVLVMSGSLVLLVMSLPLTGDRLVRSLELKAGEYADPRELSRNDVKWIVVLGGDLRGGDLSPADRVAYSSLVRVMEGIRLWKAMPDSKLVLSGGTYSPAKDDHGTWHGLIGSRIRRASKRDCSGGPVLGYRRRGTAFEAYPGQE